MSHYFDRKFTLGKLYKVPVGPGTFIKNINEVTIMAYQPNTREHYKYDVLKSDIVMYIEHSDISELNVFMQDNHKFIFYQSYIERSLILIS